MVDKTRRKNFLSCQNNGVKLVLEILQGWGVDNLRWERAAGVCSCVCIVADVCMYMGKSYTQGQQWDDGCSKVCVCEDAKTGFYRCSDR